MNELEKLLDIFTAVMSAVKDFISQIIKTTYLEIIIKIIFIYFEDLEALNSVREGD